MMKSKKVFLLFLLGSMYLLPPAFSQNVVQNSSITITELIDVLVREGDSKEEIRFDNYQILYTDAALRKQNGLFKYFKNIYPQRINTKGFIDIKSKLVLNNCVIDNPLYFNQFNFIGGLEIRNSQCDILSLKHCNSTKIELAENEINNTIELMDGEVQELILMGNTIGSGVAIENNTGNSLSIEKNILSNGEITIYNCQIKGGSVIIGDNETLAVILEECAVEMGPYGEFNNYKLPGTSSSDLYLKANTFSGDSTTRVIFNKGNYLNLDVRENVFNTMVYFVENNVHERFFLVQNQFNQKVSFEKFLFSEIWNELYWNQLAGHKLRYNDYGALRKEDFTEDIKFKNLINIYKDMHSIFISRGDLESANACYSEMKELQGQMLKHVYSQKSSFGNLLRWQLNVLLRIYTNHGTDPGLAVVMSLYVIMAFSILYMFFPSEWDIDSKNRLLVSYEKLLQHKGKSFLAPIMVVVGSVLLTVTNAATLSINSFVTLGFGSIPTKGFSRYLCIIEGFIGWFLLSIFTVSLINQVLA